VTKYVDVILQQIACTANGFGGAVQISGDLFGATFQNDPNNPNDLKVQQDIFPFPNGPISISEGQVVPITMESVRFTLGTGHEPPDLFTKFLKFGGSLNPGLGSQFRAIGFDESLPLSPAAGGEDPPAKYDLAYTSPNLRVTLTFGLSVDPRA
jgi:hypothetical protein